MFVPPNALHDFLNLREFISGPVHEVGQPQRRLALSDIADFSDVPREKLGAAEFTVKGGEA